MHYSFYCVIFLFKLINKGTFIDSNGFETIKNVLERYDLGSTVLGGEPQEGEDRPYLTIFNHGDHGSTLNALQFAGVLPKKTGYEKGRPTGPQLKVLDFGDDGITFEDTNAVPR